MQTLARTTDPITSHLAAESATHLQWHTRVITEAIDREPGRTGKQLAAEVGLDFVQVARRSGDLKKLGYYTEVREGEREQRWFPPRPVCTVQKGLW